MKKLLNTVWDNIIFIFTLFLLAFIPLYPKLPLFDVPNTWVYIRAEDFIVAIVLGLWGFLILSKKIKFKTPLTIPILVFWIIGAISTLHGVLILFPQLANVFPNVALLSFLRKIEYMSLFFIGFAAIKNKKSIYYVISVLAVTLLLIVLYGLGQRFLGFPAYLTGNEEFAKGVAVRVSELGRIPSTFAGHYDLAAYLVLIIPVLVSLVFGFKNLILKTGLIAVSILGFGLLFMTVSRVSLVALLASLFALLIFYRQKFFIISLGILALIFLIVSPSLLQRYQGTVKEIDVLFDIKNEKVLGQVMEVGNDYFKDKIIFRTSVDNAQLSPELLTSPAIVYPELLPPSVYILLQPNVPTGEFLPQGTGYVNLPMSPVKEKVASYIVESRKETGTKNDEIRLHEGEFLVKRARAYDLSFTTRFQGGWPKAVDAFLRNVFIGSGSGSVSLAVDNNYLRILGESGILGFGSFILLFLTAIIYIVRTYPLLRSNVLRSFILGFMAGSLGLILNGILIDVFEASKIAFTYWLLMGVALGALHFYTKSRVNLFYALRKVLLSPVAIAFYLVLANILLFIPMHTNYFVGDDFTWLRWASEGGSIFKLFTDSEGFFWRPGTKIYFMLMNNVFWFNQNVYHIVSIIVHSLSVLAFFVILCKILRNYALSAVGVFLFIVLTGHQEAVFWISATGFLYTAFFAFLSLLLYVLWKEKNNKLFFFFSIVSASLSFLFHELGVVTVLLLISYDLIFWRGFKFDKLPRPGRPRNSFLFKFTSVGENPGGYTSIASEGLKPFLAFIRALKGHGVLLNAYKLLNREYAFILLPLIPYFFLRYVAQSHWFSGDYSYSFVKFPFNALGNSLGYIALSFLGPQVLSFYSGLRVVLRGNMFFSLILSAVFLVFLYFVVRLLMNKLEAFEKRLVLFGVLFFLIALLPFLGLGNIAARYGYMATAAFAFILPVFIKKGYQYLRTISDKYTSYLIAAFLTLSFLSFYLFQVQKSHEDWKFTGDVSRNFLVSFQGYYKETWTEGEWDFYFVDTPTRWGDAWIFPVGLPDAVALSLKNLNLNVYQAATLEDAFAKVSSTSSAVFKFEPDGKVKEYQRLGNGEIKEVK